MGKEMQPLHPIMYEGKNPCREKKTTVHVGVYLTLRFVTDYTYTLYLYLYQLFPSGKKYLVALTFNNC